MRCDGDGDLVMVKKKWHGGGCGVAEKNAKGDGVKKKWRGGGVVKRWRERGVGEKTDMVKFLVMVKKNGHGEKKWTWGKKNGHGEQKRVTKQSQRKEMEI